jgi:hypothetical protein
MQFISIVNYNIHDYFPSQENQDELAQVIIEKDFSSESD